MSCAFIGYLIFIFTLGYSVEAKFPTHLEQCKFEDSKCLTKVAQTVIEKFSSAGIPELNIPQLDPLYAKKLSTKDVPESALTAAYNINLELTDLITTGYSKNKIEHIEFRRKNNKIKMLIEFQLPRLNVLADYKIDGSLLNVLPVRGNGKFNITLENPFFVLKGTANLVNRNGDDYIAIDKFQARYNTTRAYTYLDNLFDGDVELEKTINEFINNNWKELFDGFSRPYFEFQAVVFRDLLTNLFNAIPFKELFL